MCACCTIHPSEAPKRLGLRVLRARGCRGRKQRKVGWSKTMVWPPSAPSQMCMGRGARNQIARVCCKHVRNAGVRPPSDSEPGVAGSGPRVSALCYAVRKKLTGVEPPSAPSRKWPGRGTWTEPLVLLTGRNVVTVLCSKNWSECYRRSLLACRCLVVSPLRCCRVLPMAARACASPSST